MSTETGQTIETIKERALPILQQNRVRKAGLFGSVVRGEMTAGSDIDFLVEIDPSLSLLDLVTLKLELEGVLDRHVDVVEYETLKPALRERVLFEQVPIL